MWICPKSKKVTSIDTNPDAISVTRQNLEKFNLGDNVELINDSGSNALKNIDNMDIAVVGGSGRELEDILEIIDSKLNPKGRIIVTAILVDTKIEAINKLKSWIIILKSWKSIFQMGEFLTVGLWW